jgi:hypothetical protein
MRTPEVAVAPLPKERLVQAEYDAFVASVGFEQRAWFVAEQLSPRATRRLACGFGARRELAYSKNQRLFARAGFELSDYSEEDFPSWWDGVLNETKVSHNDVLRLCIDVSSMSRRRAGVIMASLLELSRERRIVVDFVYSIARFSRPAKEGTPIEVCAPVVPQFAGWSERPEDPAVTIFGLGYEEDKALGAVEYLEPARCWAFVPGGEDPRYNEALLRANKNFLQAMAPHALVSYQVDRPFDSFTLLESLTYGNLTDSRVILVPFGPKIFSLICLIVAAVHWPKVAVWRVSSGQNEPAQDRVANGKIVGLRVSFGQRASTPA